jgi:DnaJ-class molecular chaperone
MNCPKCNGTGYIDSDEKSAFKGIFVCGFCSGNGDVNWIENIFGVEPKPGIKIWGQKTLLKRGTK